jgi:hypothetical protein
MTLEMQQTDTPEDNHDALEWSKPVSRRYSQIISKHISSVMPTDKSVETIEPIMIYLTLWRTGFILLGVY